MITYDILISILESPYKWELIEYIYTVDPSFYEKINTIYAECLFKHGQDYGKYIRIMGIGLNICFLAFLSISKLQFHQMFKDQAYLLYQFNMRRLNNPNLTLADFRYEAEKIDATLIPIMQYMTELLYPQVFFKHLFKSQEFQTEFNKRVAEHICYLLNDDSFGIQLLEYLSTLFH